jgi:hypothetical protein
VARVLFAGDDFPMTASSAFNSISCILTNKPRRSASRRTGPQNPMGRVCT